MFSLTGQVKSAVPIMEETQAQNTSKTKLPEQQDVTLKQTVYYSIVWCFTYCYFTNNYYYY